MRFLIALVLTVSCSTTTFAKDEKKEFVVNDPGGRDTVRFVLDAPFEVINGVTNTVKGKFNFDKGKFSANFTVPVSSLKTGIAKRDEHLQNDKWLNAAKNPNIELTVKDAAISENLWKNSEVTTEVDGEFKVHGVTKKEKVKLTFRHFPADETSAKRLPGNLMRVKADFQLSLPDYGIAQRDSKAKELIGLKVGKVAAITADLMASDQSKL